MFRTIPKDREIDYVKSRFKGSGYQFIFWCFIVIIQIKLNLTQKLFIVCLFLKFQGVTYDTGGADIKAGGIMAGMSR